MITFRAMPPETLSISYKAASPPESLCVISLSSSRINPDVSISESWSGVTRSTCWLSPEKEINAISSVNSAFILSFFDRRIASLFDYWMSSLMGERFQPSSNPKGAAESNLIKLNRLHGVDPSNHHTRNNQRAQTNDQCANIQ